jgi:hypothetical protein
MRIAVLTGLVLAGLLGVAPLRTEAQPSPAPSDTEMRELVEAARAGAKAARENVEYARVVPDILTQILAKLDKIEDKLDKVENAIKAGPPRRAGGR